jgi:solute carrier family 35 protein F1/2
MKWQGLLLGQGVCLLNTSTAVLASLLVACDISAPLYQLLWFYIGLALGCGALLIRSVLRKEVPLTFGRALRVSVSCLPDSQGQFLMLLSFSYTSLTSVSVLMQSGFVMVAIMSRVFNGKRYRLPQICGLVGCTAGVGILIAGDLQMEEWKLGGLFLGDILALLGVFLYSV